MALPRPLPWRLRGWHADSVRCFAGSAPSLRTVIANFARAVAMVVVIPRRNPMKVRRRIISPSRRRCSSSSAVRLADSLAVCARSVMCLRWPAAHAHSHVCCHPRGITTISPPSVASLSNLEAHAGAPDALTAAAMASRRRRWACKLVSRRASSKICRQLSARSRGVTFGLPIAERISSSDEPNGNAVSQEIASRRRLSE